MENSNKGKIKICYLVSSLCNEGPVNVIYNIIKYIDYERFSVSIITFIPEKETTRIEEFKRLPISIFQLSPNKNIGLFTIYFKLRRQLSKIVPDILHAHCPRSLFIMPYLPKCYKKVYTIHIYPGEQQLKLYGHVKGRIVIALDHYFTKKCDLAIGCAESVGWQYKKEKGWDIPCIPNGASLPVWVRDEKERASLRNEFGLKDGVKYFIFIGRFSKEKNPDILFKTFKDINRTDVGLIMLGNGLMWDNLKADCPSQIIMPGFTNRVYDYIKASDYYISASDVEGLANTILESMSVGLPMLLSDIPSHQEILQNIKYEHIGSFIDNKNPNDIMEKVDMIMSIDHKRVSTILQHLYERKYTAEVMSRKYQNAYIELMRK